MVRILIADDHEMFREMLRLALATNPGLEVVGEAGDGREVLAIADRCRPSVILLDYKMPFVPDFTELVRTIRTRHPEIHVVVLSGFCDSEVAIRAAKGGARGYVLKTTRLVAVAEAVRSVAHGGIWIDPSLDRRVFDVFQREAARLDGTLDEGPPLLTRREHEVLACIAEGLTNRAAAKKLCISEQTVKTHLNRIFAKLGVANRMEAALCFLGKRDVAADQATWES